MAKPNILLITSDQQRTDSLSCYGSTFTHTPNFDRLAAGGALFDRAYCTNPVCTPSRASIFTGLSVSRHGAWNVGMNLSEDVPLISHRLAAVDYRTHCIGKAHFQAFGGTPQQSAECCVQKNDRYPAWKGPYYGFQNVELALGHTTFGFQQGHYAHWLREQISENDFKSVVKYKHVGNGTDTFGGEPYDWNLPSRLHNSTWTADRTIDFLQRVGTERPFFLAVGFQDPHHPHCLPLDFSDRVDPSRVPAPDFVEGELDDKPPHFLLARHGKLETSEFRGAYYVAGQAISDPYVSVSKADAQMGRAYYYNMVRLMDAQIGRILDCLDRTGLAENTLVIFTSDHGELLGDHGLWMKGPFHYEPLIRIPLIIRWPGGIPDGQRTSTMISLVDLVPTILAATGTKTNDPLDGVSALSCLRGESGAVRDRVLVECIDDPDKLRLKTLVTREHKLTWYHGYEFGELYDLKHDPHERINLWNDPSCAQQRAKLLAQLLEFGEPLERRATRYCYA